MAKPTACCRAPARCRHTRTSWTARSPKNSGSRKSAEWQAEEQQIRLAIQGLEQVRPERLLDAVRILELANKAYSLYVKQPPAEKAKLLKMVLSNCAIDAASIYPTYRKPFDLIFAQGQK